MKLSRKIIFYNLLIFTMFLSISSKSLAATCKVQGFKKYYTDDKEINNTPGPSSIFNSTVSSSVGGSSSANPYTFDINPGVQNISIVVPSGYEVGYTYCINRTDCHTNPKVLTNAFSVNCSGGEYMDIWWHFRKIGDFDENKIFDLRDIIQLLSIIFK